MPGYELATGTHRIGEIDYTICSLRDGQQFSDPDGQAERAGISSAAWPLFGVVWPAGLALAREMATIAIAGKRILEVGCGLGLSSLVLQHRGANITSSDHHPLADEFLQRNARLNGLSPIPYVDAPWESLLPDLGRFDLIIGSDVLYESQQPALLAAFLSRHANHAAEIVMTDPGRPNLGRFGSRLAEQGYTRADRKIPMGEESQAGRGRVASFVRS